jgi:hypothetical protein
MTYKRYKLILLCFLLIFALLAGSRYIIKGSDLATLILLYAFGLLYWLLLFFFLLYTRKKGIIEDNKKIAPAKLLPIVVAWIVIVSVLYPLTMAGIYKTINTMVYRTISDEDILGRAKKVAIDSSKTAEQRLNAAQYYFKYSGERIIYTDDQGRKKEYSPDNSTNRARVSHIETAKQQNNLYNFMVVSAALSLLSGGVVANIYFRTRKKYKYEKLT